MNMRPQVLLACLCLALVPEASGQSVKGSDTYRRIKAGIDAVPAIDTHDHLLPFDHVPQLMVETDHGKGMTLFSLWAQSYYPQVGTVQPRKPGETFDAWWARARHDFDNARATGFYRYHLPAFRDLYGVDFDRLTDDQARALDVKIFDNYRDERWVRDVVTKRANIELMLNDPYWGRLDFKTTYPFEVQAFNVTTLVDAHDASVHKGKPSDDPYAFARAHGLKVETIDDYLTVLDRLFEAAKAAGAVCLKSTKAYERTLLYENVPKERAAKAFGKPRSAVTPQERKDFEDYIMWRLVERSAKYDLPFQIHTGHGRLQGSSPMLLLDLIEANPKTKFILFHGGYPWVGETGAILLRHWRHVWVDSVWIATISPTMARRAFHEWLEVMPSNRLLWGADCQHVEGVYGATVLMRETLAEVLAEKVDRGDLTEEHAARIGRQVLRENALELFPQLKGKLWRGK
jgi:uncharacterized protein